MFGLDALMTEQNDWDVTTKDFPISSYIHWKETRYVNCTEWILPTVGEILSGKVGNSSPGASVPVCYTPQPFKDYTQDHYVDKTLPCTCGNELVNETILFFQAATFQSWVALEGGRGLTEACLNSVAIDKTNPVQDYMSLCRTGWHFHIHGDPERHIVKD